jgi:hypothetical protein
MAMRSEFRQTVLKSARPQAAVCGPAWPAAATTGWRSRGGGPGCIMLVVDAKRPASAVVDQAVRLARTYDATLLVCAVLGLPIERTVRLEAYPRHARTVAGIRGFERSKLDRLRVRLDALGCRSDASLLVGVPHDAIVKTVAAQRVDLVIKEAMCVPENLVPNWARCDETDQALLARCPVPVLIERGPGRRGGRRALAVTHQARTLRRFDAAAEVAGAARMLEAAGFETHAHDLGADGRGEAKGRSVMARALGALTDSLSEHGFLDNVREAAGAVDADTIVAPSVSAAGPWRALGANPALRLVQWTDYSVLGVRPA